MGQLERALTRVPRVSKHDATGMLLQFGSFARMAEVRSCAFACVFD